VLTFLQTMRAVSGFLDRAAKHCAETGADPDNFSAPASTPTWRPSISRSKPLTHHAVWGLEAVKTGMFAPRPVGERCLSPT